MHRLAQTFDELRIINNQINPAFGFTFHVLRGDSAVPQFSVDPGAIDINLFRQAHDCEIALEFQGTATLMQRRGRAVDAARPSHSQSQR